MRVLVTGSAGRIGRAIYARLLRERGHEVVGLDRTPASTVDLTGDLGDPFLLRRAVRGIDAVVHAAALHAPHVNISPDSEFDRINVHATTTLAQMAAEAGARRRPPAARRSHAGERTRARGTGSPRSRRR